MLVKTKAQFIHLFTSSNGITVNTRVSKLEGIEEGFHTYKTQWSPNSIKFSIDNELVYTFSPKQKTRLIGLLTSLFMS